MAYAQNHRNVPATPNSLEATRPVWLQIESIRSQGTKACKFTDNNILHMQT